MVWLIFLICAFLPAYQIRFKIASLPMTLLEAMILICFFAWLFIKIKEVGFTPLEISRPKVAAATPKEGGFLTGLKKLICEKWQDFKNWRWLILAWLILGLAAVFIAPDLRAAAGVWKAYFLEPFLFLIVLIDVIKTAKEKNLVLNGLFFSALYLSCFVFAQKFFGGGVMSLEIWREAKIWRATSLFPQPNFLGLYLGPIILLAIGHLKSKIKNQKLKICLLIIIFLAIFSLFLARSEGALLGIFFGLLFFLFFIHQKARKITLVSFLILMVLILSFSFSRDFLIKKISFNDLSSQLRINIWQGAFSLLKTSPFLGVGLMGYQKLIPQYQKPYYSKTGELISVETHPYPHNLYLTIWLEMGFLGLLIFFSLVINFFVLIFKALRENPSSRALLLGLGGAMIVLLVHGLVDTPYFKNDLSVLFWLIIGLGIIEDKIYQGRILTKT